MKLTLEKPVYGGDCLAHTEAAGGKAGKAVFVPLTLPGETVVARVMEDKRSFARAELEEIVVPSPQRIAPSCTHFGACGGCHYQHANYPEQLAWKRQILQETLTRAGVSLPAEIAVLAAEGESEAWDYRNRIRVALTRDGRFGYRGWRSHEVIPIGECPIAAPLLFRAAEAVAAFLGHDSTPVPITEIELFTNHDASRLLVTLFCEEALRGGTQQPELESWLSRLQASLPVAATGLRLQMEDGSLQPNILASVGLESMTYSAAGFDYRVDHGAFFQVNRWLIDNFAALVTNEQSGKLAWDLYAGVGLFARRLAGSFDEVIAVESAPASLAALRQNLAGTVGRPFSSTTLDYLRRNREEREPRADLIVLDPPRAGLGDEVTSLLNAIHAPRIVYVSCDPATLARDLRALTLERYRIDSVTQVDMFPQTFHLETVVKLSRL